MKISSWNGFFLSLNEEWSYLGIISKGVFGQRVMCRFLFKNSEMWNWSLIHVLLSLSLSIHFRVPKWKYHLSFHVHFTKLNNYIESISGLLVAIVDCIRLSIVLLLNDNCSKSQTMNEHSIYYTDTCVCLFRVRMCKRARVKDNGKIKKKVLKSTTETGMKNCMWNMSAKQTGWTKMQPLISGKMYDPFYTVTYRIHLYRSVLFPSIM